MTELGSKLLFGWQVQSYLAYVACAAGATLVVRMLLSAITAAESYWKSLEVHSVAWDPPASYISRVTLRFAGIRREGDIGPDYWLNSILGLLELLAFPILLALGAWIPVGSWLTLKTVAQWESWKAHRTVFNRFLIGNALVLIMSAFLGMHFVALRLPVNCTW
jgi:hypothetical protein